MTSFWLFGMEKEITTEFVIRVILAPSPENFTCNFNWRSDISRIFAVSTEERNYVDLHIARINI